MASPLIEHSKAGFRAWFRKVWQVRGGGLYAVGFAATFIYLEAVSLADDVLGIGALFRGEAIEFFVNFIIDSFMNTIAAFLWPVDVIQFAPPVGLMALGIAFWLFPIYVKPHIERWLFDDDPEQAVDSDEDSEVA